jgi:hypothetical protein
VASSHENALLARLPRIERERVERHCTTVQMAPGDVLNPDQGPATHVWFPTGALVATMAEGGMRDTLAVGLVGNEGLLGGSLMLGAGGTPLRLLAQGAGSALRLDAEAFRRVLHDVPRFERLLRLLLHAELALHAQLAVCAAFHLVPMRVAFWLLATHDRSTGDRFYLTHDLLARLLGVRRSGVTAAAGVLQQQGLITYTRGRVLVLDRKGLERASCTCYEAARAALQPLFDAEAGHHPADEIGARRIARAAVPNRTEDDTPPAPRVIIGRR